MSHLLSYFWTQRKKAGLYNKKSPQQREVRFASHAHFVRRQAAVLRSAASGTQA